MILTKIIYELCDKKNINISEAATKAGISQPYLSQIANGTRNPTIKTAQKLANVFGVSLSELLGEAGKRRGDKISATVKTDQQNQSG